MSNEFLFIENELFPGERVFISRSALSRYRREGWKPCKPNAKPETEAEPESRNILSRKKS